MQPRGIERPVAGERGTDLDDAAVLDGHVGAALDRVGRGRCRP